MLFKLIIVDPFNFSSLEVSRETRSTAVFFFLNIGIPRPEFCRYVIYV